METMQSPKTIALSGWLAYVPFRVIAAELRRLGIDIKDGAHDRVDGLVSGRYAAAPMSSYALVEALPLLGESVGVAWNTVVPVGAGSDRIVVRSEITTVATLREARIGVTPHGLEPHLFEHLFDSVGLPPKTDYIVLPSRATYLDAFAENKIDAVMAPQPSRAQLLTRVPGTAVFEADRDLPRFGLYAPLVYRRADWTPDLLNQVHEIFSRTALQLATLDDDALRAAHPSSFEGIVSPVAEVQETLRWPATEESARYLAEHFLGHLQEIADLRTRRLGAPAIAPKVLRTLTK